MKNLIASILIVFCSINTNAQVFDVITNDLTSINISPAGTNNGSSEINLFQDPMGMSAFKLKYSGLEKLFSINNYFSLYGNTFVDPLFTIGTDGTTNLFGVSKFAQSVYFNGQTLFNKGSLRMQGSNHIIFENPNGHGVVSFGNNGVGNLYFRSCNTLGCQDGTYNSLMMITSAGEVGIGTVNPNGYKLAVNGSIRAKSMDIESGWADFVFADDYNLLSLEDLEVFIQTENHLPDVPTEEYILENGANIGDTQVLLLQKVEELTIYIIELNKRISELENELK